MHNQFNQDRDNFIMQIILKILMIQGFYLIHAIIFRISFILLVFKQQGFQQNSQLGIFVFLLVICIYNTCLFIKIIVLFVRTILIELDDIIFGITQFLRNKNPNYNIFEFDCLDFMLWQKNISSKLNKIYCLIFIYGNIVLMLNFNELSLNKFSHRLLILIVCSSYIYLIILIVIKFSNLISICTVANIQEKLQQQDRVSDIIQNLIINKNRYSNSQKTCMICLQQIQQLIVILPCNQHHYFHDKCIKNWLRNKISCPLCRINLSKFYIELK